MARMTDKPTENANRTIDANDPATRAALRKLKLDEVHFGEPLRPLVALRRLFRR